MSNRAKAYSYLRFSTPEQMQGDSYRRQTQLARDYARRHGLDLDDELTFRDLGVSAYRGANAVEGALGRFIEAVDSGRVKSGSYLLVENLDRLSRDKVVSALSRFSSLLEKGVRIVTLIDEKVYTANSSIPDIMLSLLTMGRANEESELKSRRVSAAWQAKRERAANEGHVLTARCPAWLRVKDGKFELIKERAAVVRRIFDMALKGHGKASIAHRLNAQGTPPFGTADGWHASYIQKILGNPAVIGRYQPMRRIYVEGKKQRVPDGEVIEDYFPVVLKDRNSFYRLKRGPAGASGYKGNALANVLSGLVVCQHCGGRMHYVNKGATPKGGSYLACDNVRRKGTCTAKSVRYNVALSAVLSCLSGDQFDLRSLLGNGHDDMRQELLSRIEGLEGRIDETEAGIGNLLGVLERRPSSAVEKRLADHEAALQQLRQERETLEAELHSAGNGPDPIEDAKARIAEMKRQRASGDLNVKVNAALKRLISTIEVGHASDAREFLFENWGGKPVTAKTRLTDAEASILDTADVSINVAFRDEGKHFIIAADPRHPRKFVAAAATGKGNKLRGHYGWVRTYRLHKTLVRPAH